MRQGNKALSLFSGGGSQCRRLCSTAGHLGTSGDRFGWHNWRAGWHGHLVQERPWMPLPILQCTERTATKNSLLAMSTEHRETWSQGREAGGRAREQGPA